MKNHEKSTLEKLAKRYADEGYEVLLERDAQQALPEDLRHFVPDMVLLRGDEKIIVELIQQGVSHDQLKSLAEKVQQHPNWRLDVQLVKSPETLIEVVPDDIRIALEKAERLFSSDDELAAFLVLWSAFEAGARAALSPDKDMVFDAAGAPSSLIKQLVFEGIIEDQDHDRLMELEKVRHMAVHGGLTVPVDHADFDFLMKITMDLIAPFEPDSQVA